MKYKYNVRTQRVLADLQTPVGLYLKIRDLYPESVLLESSDHHGGEDSYSFIGVQPLARFVLQGRSLSLEGGDGRKEVVELGDDLRLTERLQQFIDCFDVQGENPSGINGFFGYSAYDAVSHFEQVDTYNAPTAGADIPQMYYAFYRYILVVNHVKNELTYVENIPEGDESRLQSLEAVVRNNSVPAYPFARVGEEESSSTDEDFLSMVRKGISHCQRGDVFQIVLSRCFSQGFVGDEFQLYRTLRSINPSPYLFYFDFGAFRIFGSSPETHCRVSKGLAYIDPIAGTYKRTGDDAEDRRLSETLLKDEKENAEHVMLVDLARNDLSRNCSDVRLSFYKHVQYYSHVIHLVSRVQGLVRGGVSSLKVFADTFPAGTLTGAPKVRAMQLIRDIEPHVRGAYGGCIGYIGLNGDLNQAITIRSFVSRAGRLYYQAGAGVVSKSTPESELQEVNNKLGALKRAIVMAEAGTI